jgi:hypothetical protein
MLCKLLQRQNKVDKRGATERKFTGNHSDTVKQLIATYGPFDGLKNTLGNRENQGKFSLATSESQAELLQLATKLVFQEARHRDSKNPHIAGCRLNKVNKKAQFLRTCYVYISLVPITQTHSNELPLSSDPDG